MPTGTLYELPVNANPPPPFADTQLVISGWGQLIYQARGLTQSLEVIPQAFEQDYDVNANRIDLSNPAFRKYQSTITCSDRRPPPMDALFPGAIVTVHCTTPLCYLNGNPGSPNRPEASGSSLSFNGFTFYRPILDMMVGPLSWRLEDWEATVGWQIQLFEV
jgi:hypothetical protein